MYKLKKSYLYLYTKEILFISIETKQGNAAHSPGTHPKETLNISRSIPKHMKLSNTMYSSTFT